MRMLFGLALPSRADRAAGRHDARGPASLILRALIGRRSIAKDLNRRRPAARWLERATRIGKQLRLSASTSLPNRLRDFQSPAISRPKPGNSNASSAVKRQPCWEGSVVALVSMSRAVVAGGFVTLTAHGH